MKIDTKCCVGYQYNNCDAFCPVELCEKEVINIALIFSNSGYLLFLRLFNSQLSMPASPSKLSIEARNGAFPLLYERNGSSER